MYSQDRKDRLLKKVTELAGFYMEVTAVVGADAQQMNGDVFHHVLLLVVQCKFEEAIQLINKTISSRITTDASTIDRLLVLCNVITTVCSAKGDLNLIDTTISLQLTYYTYFNSSPHSKQREESRDLQNPAVPSPLHPLRYRQQPGARSRLQRPHGAQLPRRHLRTSPPLFSYAGRLHSHAAGCIRAAALPLQRQSHRLPLLSSSRCIVVRALESRFVKEGYLLGIAFMGFRSSELRQLLQVAILFSYPAALREPHGRRADGVDVVARR